MFYFCSLLPTVLEIEKGPLTISAQENVKVVYYRALYPFESRSHDEITIQPGDIVMVRKTPVKVWFLSMISTCPLLHFIWQREGVTECDIQ